MTIRQLCDFTYGVALALLGVGVIALWLPYIIAGATVALGMRWLNRLED